jgi:hypothetical protein
MMPRRNACPPVPLGECREAVLSCSGPNHWASGGRLYDGPALKAKPLEEGNEWSSARGRPIGPTAPVGVQVATVYEQYAGRRA